jgi:uncharacterized membrane protein YbaN (DUF454 family)
LTEQIRRLVVRYFFLTFGSLFLALGVIGIFLPLLPTTPFLILAAFCFNRGSDKFHGWLINHRIFGPPIRDWNQHRMIRTKYKLMATTMMSITLVFVLMKPTIPPVGKISYSIFMASMLAYIWSRRGR